MHSAPRAIDPTTTAGCILSVLVFAGIFLPAMAVVAAVGFGQFWSSHVLTFLLVPIGNTAGFFALGRHPQEFEAPGRVLPFAIGLSAGVAATYATLFGQLFLTEFPAGATSGLLFLAEGVELVPLTGLVAAMSLWSALPAWPQFKACGLLMGASLVVALSVLTPS